MGVLIGIARLAAESPLLDAKSRVQYFDLPTRSVLNASRAPQLPFRWTINPYRGCEFACRYCYARYTHEFMGMPDAADFENRIYAKAGVARLLREELRRTPAGEAIAIGTATDPYQPAESRYRRTRQILEVFAAVGGRSVSITTKSNRIVEDLELLKRVARTNMLSVNLTVTTLDERLAGLLEPRAPRPDLRLTAVAALNREGVQAGVYAMPLLPLLTDSEAALDGLTGAAAQAGASHFGASVLFLRASAKQVFFPFLAEHFPHLLRRYRERYDASPFLRGEYANRLRDRVARLRARHGLAASPADYEPQAWGGEEQGTLFPLH